MFVCGDVAEAIWEESLPRFDQFSMLILLSMARSRRDLQVVQSPKKTHRRVGSKAIVEAVLFFLLSI